MDDAGLPADAEFRAALHAYMVWAVADVLTYSPIDAVVPAGARDAALGLGRPAARVSAILGQWEVP